MGRRGLSAYSPRRSDGWLLSSTRLPPGLHRCLRAAIGSGSVADPASLPGGVGGGPAGRLPETQPARAVLVLLNSRSSDRFDTVQVRWGQQTH
jgi:hypothetical protein